MGVQLANASAENIKKKIAEKRNFTLKLSEFLHFLFSKIACLKVQYWKKNSQKSLNETLYIRDGNKIILGSA